MNENSIEKFSKRVQLACRGFLTSGELLSVFFDYVRANPQDLRDFVAMLPRNLISELRQLLDLPDREWCKEVRSSGWLRPQPEIRLEEIQESLTMRSSLRSFFADVDSSFTFAEDLNFVSQQAEVTPCPYCGEPLRTDKAKQCRFCKQDWHDPENLQRLG